MFAIGARRPPISFPTDSVGKAPAAIFCGANDEELMVGDAEHSSRPVVNGFAMAVNMTDANGPHNYT